MLNISETLKLSSTFIIHDKISLFFLFSFVAWYYDSINLVLKKIQQISHNHFLKFSFIEISNVYVPAFVCVYMCVC
jgi:hypothetical protein